MFDFPTRPQSTQNTEGMDTSASTSHCPPVKKETNPWASEAFLANTRPISRSRTNYSMMNEWITMPRPQHMGTRVISPQSVPRQTGIPVTMSDTNWQHVKMMESSHGGQRRNEELGHDEIFRRDYAELSKKIAYRYPDPGMPRIRQGRVGGSWRHIREVLGHGGSRVLFVDGLVRRYDTEKFNQTLTQQRPLQILPNYSVTGDRYDVAEYKRRLQSDMEKFCKPRETQSRPFMTRSMDCLPPIPRQPAHNSQDYSQ